MDTTLQWAWSNGHLIVSKILHTPVHYYLAFSCNGYRALFSPQCISRPHPQGLLICSWFRNFYTEVALVTQELQTSTQLNYAMVCLLQGFSFLRQWQRPIFRVPQEACRRRAGAMLECVCVGRRCKEESSCCSIIYFTTNQPETRKKHELKVTVRV